MDDFYRFDKINSFFGVFDPLDYLNFVILPKISFCKISKFFSIFFYPNPEIFSQNFEKFFDKNDGKIDNFFLS